MAAAAVWPAQSPTDATIDRWPFHPFAHSLAVIDGTSTTAVMVGKLVAAALRAG